MLMRCNEIRESQLDECLPADTDATGFAIDGVQQVHGEIDIDALHRAPWPGGFREIHMRREVLSCVV